MFSAVSSNWPISALESQVCGMQRPDGPHLRQDSFTVAGDINIGQFAYTARPEATPTLLYDAPMDIDAKPPDLEECGMRLRSTEPTYGLADKAMHETTFYDILEGIRLGEPYWLMHHGNCEHVFVFEEIRCVGDFEV